MADPYRDLEAAYRAATIGAAVPSAGVTNGAVLNRLLETDEYDIQRAYFVTAEAITPVPEEEDFDG